MVSSTLEIEYPMQYVMLCSIINATGYICMFSVFHSTQAISRKENKQCNSPDEGEAAASVSSYFICSL